MQQIAFERLLKLEWTSSLQPDAIIDSRIIDESIEPAEFCQDLPNCSLTILRDRELGDD